MQVSRATRDIPAESPLARLRSTMRDLYEAGDYLTGLKLCQEAERRGQAGSRLTYFKACFRALLGDRDGAMEELLAGIERGEWWSRERLETDADLADLRVLPHFRALLKSVDRKRLVAAEQSEAKIHLVGFERLANHRGVLLLLHKRSSNIPETLQEWRAALRHRVALAVLQSSQPSADDEFVWDDLGRAERDIQDALNLLGGLRIPGALAGFSQGGALAITLALRPGPWPQRFLAVAPSIGASSAAWTRSASLVAAVAASSGKPIRGWLMVGRRDPWFGAAGVAFARALSRRDSGVCCEVPESMGHSYPADFDKRLAPSLRHIFG
jgi:predicted esterase